jgi:RimJ/RimL family protein N-acetyltransferase
MCPAFDPAQADWIDLDARDPLGADAPDALSAAGLGLRPWRVADAPGFARIYGDARLWAHLPEPAPRDFCDAQARDLIALSQARTDQVIRAVVRKGQPIGQVRLELDGSSAELSYWLAPADWGQGLGRALVQGASDRAFARNADLLRLTAKVDARNTASLRALAAAGFRPGRAYGPTPDGWVWRVRYR